MIIGRKDLPHKIILNSKVYSSNKETLCGLLLDRALNLEGQIIFLGKEHFKKNSLARLRSYLTLDQRKFLFNSGIKSKFSYCLLIWMYNLHNHTLYNVHEEHILRKYFE